MPPTITGFNQADLIYNGNRDASSGFAAVSEEWDRCFVTKIETFDPTFKIKPKALKHIQRDLTSTLRIPWDPGPDGNNTTEQRRENRREVFKKRDRRVCLVTWRLYRALADSVVQPRACLSKSVPVQTSSCYCWITLFAKGSFG